WAAFRVAERRYWRGRGRLGFTARWVWRGRPSAPTRAASGGKRPNETEIRHGRGRGKRTGRASQWGRRDHAANRNLLFEDYLAMGHHRTETSARNSIRGSAVKKEGGILIFEDDRGRNDLLRMLVEKTAD